MKELIDAIQAWPVIVQGALGSALFYFIMQGCQSLIKWISQKYSYHSKKARLDWLINQKQKYKGILSEANIGSTPNENNINIIYTVTALNYRAARYFYKSIMWLVMGLIFQDLLFLGDIIGFMGSFYYLLKAYEVISPIERKERDNAKAILEKINNEIKTFEET